MNSEKVLMDYKNIAKRYYKTKSCVQNLLLKAKPPLK